MKRCSIALRLAGLSLIAAALMCASVRAQAQYSLDQQVNEHKNRAKQFMANKQMEQAAAEWKALLELDPADFEAHGELGFLYFAANDCPNAVTELRRATEIQPSMWREQAFLGICEARLGDQEKAAADLQGVFPHLDDPMLSRQVGMTLLHLYSHKTDMPKAAAVLAAMSEKNPNDPQLIYSAYQLYTALVGEAIINLVENNPDSVETQRVLAHEAMRYGNRESAIAHMRQALKLNPNTPGLHVELANMLNSHQIGGNRAEAEKEYKLALDADPRDEISLYKLGDIAASRGETDTALDYYSRAIKLSPDEPKANVGMARVYLALQQPAKAAPFLENVIKNDPTNDIVHYRLSAVYRQLGRMDEMKQQLDEYQKYKALKHKQRLAYGELKSQKDEPDESDVDEEKK